MVEYPAPWGIVVIGVEDDGKITGCASASQRHLNALEGLTNLCPDARWASKNVPVENSKGNDDFLLILRVSYRSDKLVETISGDAFIREGDKKLRIGEALKRELRISKGEIHYELEPVSLSYPADFDYDEIKKFCRAYHANRRFKHEKKGEEVLELAKLGSGP